MSDVKKLEEKLNNLESKLKATFEELEKKLNELAAAHSDNSENRFQELEDLVLLIQVEQMKIMERMHSSLDIGLADGNTAANTAKVAELEKIVLQMAERMDLLDDVKKTPSLSLDKEARAGKIPEISGVVEKSVKAPIAASKPAEISKPQALSKLEKILAG